jgi:hypothetical protein
MKQQLLTVEEFNALAPEVRGQVDGLPTVNGQPVQVVAETLAGHESPETAYLVEDYPYGYTLRCKIRYWLEFKPKFGFRLVSQTTNPRVPGERWNRPHAGTYHFLAVLCLNMQGHVTISTISSPYYGGEEVAAAFERVHGAALGDRERMLLDAVRRYSQQFKAAA